MSFDFIFSRPKWQQEAACRGMMRVDDTPEFFIPRGDQKQMLKRARAVCAECGVAEECLDFALRFNIEEGIWGGKSARQRRVMRGELGLTGSMDTYGPDLSAAALQAQRDRERLGDT